jgi:alpha-glucosidase
LPSLPTIITFLAGRRREAEVRGTNPHSWWQRGIIYQVYVRSFADSNGDGIGDLPGLASKLDYLSFLGVDALWLTPIHPSPDADFGYDVADYTAVNPHFGTLEDFDRLVAEASRRGLRVILDFVPNHTSDRHPWFLRSRSARDDPYRNWYLWRDPAPDGGPPNNWRSRFGGTGWEWDEPTGQYYYHTYLRQQPDLNWRNPEVERAMLGAMRFWLERGVAGFRLDAIARLLKDDLFRDNPPNPGFRSGQEPYQEFLPLYSTDRPGVVELIGKMRRVLDEYGDRVMIGEAYLTPERLVAYYGSETAGVHFPFNFQLIKLPWRADILRQAIATYDALVPGTGWPNWVLGNHDQPRVATRVGRRQARVAAMLLLTLRGTPTMYYGDEIGLENVAITPERVRDPWETNVPGFGLGRDPERTPMRWDAGPGAGFTTGEPWLPLGDDRDRVNVAAQLREADSILNLYRWLIQLRRSQPALQVGTYKPVRSAGETLCYLRGVKGQAYLIGLNLGPTDASITLPSGLTAGRIIRGTMIGREGESVNTSLVLRGDEGLIVEVQRGV